MTGYYIYANLQDGRPTLQVVDADSSTVCLHWSQSPDVTQDEQSERDIHNLFRQLMLLTCKQALKGGHRVPPVAACRRTSRYPELVQKPRKVA